MTIGITLDDINNLANAGIKGHESKIIETIDQIIKYCRHLEKEKKREGPREDKLSGIVALNQMLQRGEIKMSLYLYLRKCVENPELKYTVRIIKK